MSIRSVHALPLGVRTGIALALVSLVGAMAFAWPLLVGGESVLAQNAAAPVVLAGVLLAVVLISLVALSDGGIDAKTVTMLGLLAAIGAVLRPLSAGSAGVEFVFLFIILGGRVFGAGFGFALGSVTLFASALLTGGFGPWLPFQMLAASWIGMGAGLLPRQMRGPLELVSLAGYAAVSGFLYGQLMNLSFWPFTLGPGTGLSFVPGAPVIENLHHFALFSLTTSLGWDLMRAVVLALGVALLGRPVLSALRRTARIGSFSARSHQRPAVPPESRKVGWSESRNAD
jgi:energy-coupling factor transport system substrate-specific component